MNKIAELCQKIIDKKEWTDSEKNWCLDEIEKLQALLLERTGCASANGLPGCLKRCANTDVKAGRLCLDARIKEALE